MAEPSPPAVFPSELPVLPLRRTVVFPLTLQPLAVNRPMSVEAVNAALAGDRLILLLLQKGDEDEPNASKCTTSARLASCARWPAVHRG